MRFTWDAGSGATSYRIEAGSTPGASDLAALVVPGTELTYAQSVPNGAYYVRVRALNAVGASEPSNELALVVGACARPPDPPAALTAQATALVATLAWAPSPSSTAWAARRSTSTRTWRSNEFARGWKRR